MFPRRLRLDRRDFEVVSRRARRYTSPYLTVLISRQATGYAVVVSKKVAKRSVDRHHLKRRIVGVLRTTPLPPGLIVYPRKEVLTLSTTRIRADLLGLLSQYGRDTVQ